LPQRRVRGSVRAPAAGAPPPGSPPRWAPVGPSAVVSAAHEPGRVGYRLWGVGAAFRCPKWPVPLSRLFGGGLESHRNPLKSVRSASEWCGVGHHHVPVKCARGYPRKRPGSTPNPKSGSEIAIDTRRCMCVSIRSILSSCCLPLELFRGTGQLTSGNGSLSLRSSSSLPPSRACVMQASYPPHWEGARGSSGLSAVVG
jgi:hypothetical protein